MSGTANSNGRDGSEAWVEGLLTGAGASIGRVLDDRQVHAANLTIEVFAYLLSALLMQKVEVCDVIRMMKWYARGINDAKSQQG
jgi:hypothetical protein